MDVYDTGRDDIADTLRQTVVITFAMSFWCVYAPPGGGWSGTDTKLLVRQVTVLGIHLCRAVSILYPIVIGLIRRIV